MKIEGFGNVVQEPTLHQIHLQPQVNSRRKTMSAQQEFKWFIAAVLGWLLAMVAIASMV